jgi:DNA-binding transcriptional LysR family regulator
MHNNKPEHALAVLSEFRTPSTYSAVGLRLGVAHTTVARKIRELEVYYGTPLVERIGDALNLTEAGSRAADAGERMDAELEGLERRISAHDENLVGSITLTTVDILANRYMPAIAGFLSKHPGIELRLDTNSAIRSLSRREAEVALRATNAPEDYLSGVMLERFDFYAYQRAYPGSTDVALSDLRWIDYQRNECAARAEQWMMDHAGGARPQFYVSTPSVMVEALRSGAGAGMLPSVVADQYPELRRVSDIVSFNLDVWLLTPKELRKSARVRALFAALRAPLD